MHKLSQNNPIFQRTKIRLRVNTNLNTKFLYAIYHTATISQLMQDLKIAYQEFLSNQNHPLANKNLQISKVALLKKGDFYIRQIEQVSNLFDDMDEIYCEYEFNKLNDQIRQQDIREEQYIINSNEQVGKKQEEIRRIKQKTDKKDKIINQIDRGQQSKIKKNKKIKIESKQIDKSQQMKKIAQIVKKMKQLQKS